MYVYVYIYLYVYCLFKGVVIMFYDLVNNFVLNFCSLVGYAVIPFLLFKLVSIFVNKIISVRKSAGLDNNK